MEETRKKVVIIPAKKFDTSSFDAEIIKKKRVCAYARVSTDLDDQKNSFEAQLDEYSRRIRENPKWEFVKLYSDEGISGTTVDQRTGFKEMIKDAENGKIDMILTKSISRFARNTIDCLTVIRKMRAIGVEIYFEKENLYASDSKTDFIMTVMASVAQEESRSISENVKWGKRKRMADGKVYVPSKFLGYRKGTNGEFIIQKDEAETIRAIFHMFVRGDALCNIIDWLKKNKRLNINGECKWTYSHIQQILRNEKYCGNALLQKTYRKDFLTHRSSKNNGEIPQYFIEDHHEPIISKDIFNLVQDMLNCTDEKFKTTLKSRLNPITELVMCGGCGRQAYKIVQHSGTKFAKSVFTCKSNRERSLIKTPCENKPFNYELTIEATNDLMHFLIKDYLKNTDIVSDAIIEVETSTSIADKLTDLNQQILEAETRIQEIIKDTIKNGETEENRNLFYKEKAHQKLLQEQYDELSQTTIKAKQEEIRRKTINGFIERNSLYSPLLYRMFLSKIIQIDKTHILFVLGDKKVSNKELFNNLSNLMNLPKVYEGYKKNKTDELYYSAVKLEDLK